MQKRKVVFDVVVLGAYLLAAIPALTGIQLHEYVGIGAFLIMMTHIVLSAGGLTAGRRWGHMILNAALLVSLAACVVSGVMVSGAVLPSLGLYATGYFFWDPLHALSAKALLAALLVHLALRGPIAWAAIKRYARRSFGQEEDFDGGAATPR